MADESTIHNDGRDMHLVTLPRPAFGVEKNVVTCMSIEQHGGSIVKIDLVCAQRSNSEMTSAIVVLHSSKALFAARNDGERRDLRAHLSRRTIRHEQIVLDQRCSHSRDIGIMAGEVIDLIVHSIWKKS